MLEPDNGNRSHQTDVVLRKVQNIRSGFLDVHMQGLAGSFAQQSEPFQAIFDSNEAHEMPLPEPWSSRLSSFQKLAVLRCLRPDKVTPLMHSAFTMPTCCQDTLWYILGSRCLIACQAVTHSPFTFISLV